MANMSYCRFRNTLEALEDCSEHLDDTDLSSEEEKAKIKLLKLCAQLAYENGQIDDDFGYLE